MIRLASLIIAASVAVACGPSTKPGPQPPPPGPTTTTTAPPSTPEPPTKPNVAGVPWDKSGIDWTRRPGAGPTPRFSAPRPTTFRLANKLRVVVVPNRKLPVVSMRLVNDRAGSKYERAKRSGLAALTADLLDEGAGKHDALGLSKELERLGAAMWISAGEEDVTVGVTTLSSTMIHSLRLLTSVVSKPRLTNKDFKRVRGDRLSAIRRRRDNPRSVASLLYSKVLWGDHAYGRPLSGTAKTLKKLRLGDVRRYYRNHYAPRFMTLLVAGDVDPTSLRNNLNLTIGRWRKRVATPRLRQKPTPVKTPARLVVANKPNAAQSVVRIGRIAIARKDNRYFPATVVNAALGGSFAARLMNRLREQLGYTYGVRSSFWFGDKIGTWTVRTSLKTANTIDGLREAFKLIDGVRLKDLPAEELARTKNLLIRGLPQRFSRNSARLSVFGSLLSHGLPLDWYDGYAQGVRGVTIAQARAFANANWDRNNLVVIVVGDLKKILPGLLKLGLGPALELDPEGNVVKTHPAADIK